MSEPRTSATGDHALWVSTSMTTRGGVSSFVRAMRDTPLWEKWGVRHIATHRDGSTIARITTFLTAIPALLAQIVTDRPSVVHVHMASYGSFVRKCVVVWIARAARVPVVVHVHGAEFHQFYARSPKPMKMLIRATLHTAAVVIALGERWRDRLLEVAPDARIIIVPNAVAPGHPVTQPAAAEPVEVLFLGRVSDRKGTFLLLDAWAAAGIADRARLVIAGDGEVDRARRRVDELGIAESVDVLGWVDSDRVAALIGSAHVLTLPSRNEGQPMAILEAMGRGLCIIATDTGGIPDLIGDGCGIVLPIDDESRLTDALRRVVDDGAMRTDLGANALARAREEFDIDVVWQRIDDIYRSVCP